MLCAICLETIQDGHGNNGLPVVDNKVCNFCNTSVVIPARFLEMEKGDQSVAD